MFALLAAVFFALGAFIPDFHSHSWTSWLMLGLAALALHFAYAIALPALQSRRGPG